MLTVGVRETVEKDVLAFPEIFTSGVFLRCVWFLGGTYEGRGEVYKSSSSLFLGFCGPDQLALRGSRHSGPHTCKF